MVGDIAFGPHRCPFAYLHMVDATNSTERGYHNLVVQDEAGRETLACIGKRVDTFQTGIEIQLHVLAQLHVLHPSQVQACATQNQTGAMLKLGLQIGSVDQAEEVLDLEIEGAQWQLGKGPCEHVEQCEYYFLHFWDIYLGLLSVRASTLERPVKPWISERRKKVPTPRLFIGLFRCKIRPPHCFKPMKQLFQAYETPVSSV